MISRWSLILTLLVTTLKVQSQCLFDARVVLSPRIANYNIDLVLDTESKSISAHQKILWVNPSNDTLSEVRMYMYPNAFKNTETTFLKGANNVFGRDFRGRDTLAWGGIDITSISNSGTGLLDSIRYIQPDDGNPNDETVLQVMLNEPLYPGDSLHLDIDFVTKLPELLVRIGYSRDDFYHVTHWFPQMGVYEATNEGTWGWNCHQFFRGTEFYSDFGNYLVSIDAPDHLIIEASGCRIEEVDVEGGRRKVTYQADDVIDFAWVAYPYFHRFEDEWNGIEIRLLTATEHDNLAPRFIHAVKSALAYLDENVGPYPYPSITLMDPPIHALGSGFMEYPTYITLGSFRYFPEGVRTIESLVMHEFTHQYFMGMLASNEKEEAWLDEGFVTYYEDRIMEATYGQRSSMISLMGLEISSSEFSRGEYLDLPDPNVTPVAIPGWEIQEGYKGLIYSKTATVLRTMEGMLGRATMDAIMKRYFEQWKFRHPRGQDFINVVKEVLNDSQDTDGLGDVDRFFEQLIYGAETCDYAVTSISNSRMPAVSGNFGSMVSPDFSVDDREGWQGTIELRRLGGVVLPVEIKITFEDGSFSNEEWYSDEKLLIRNYEKRVLSCEIDPQRKLMIDIDRLNNSYTLEPDPWAVRKIGAKAIFWIQNILQSLSFLV